MAAAPRALLRRRRWVYADGRRYVAIPRRLVLLGLVLLPTLPLSARAAATPTLIVLPQRGPVGTAFRVEGRGLPGQATVVLVVYTIVPNPAGGTAGSRAEQTVFDRPWPVGAGGELVVPLDSTGFTPGDYTAVLPRCRGGRSARSRSPGCRPRSRPRAAGGRATRVTVPDPRPPRLSRLPTRSMPTVARLSRCSRTPR